MGSFRLLHPWTLGLLAASSLALGSVAPQAIAQGKVYQPIPFPSGGSVSDTLSDADIPTGQGNFARDYVIKFQAGDQIAIDLTSDTFDTVITLLSDRGDTIGENDDGPDGGTNSLLFVRLTKGGDYIIRVRSFGKAKGGPFTLKVTRLRPI